MILLTFIFIAIGIQLPYLFFLLLNIAPFFRLIQFSFRWDILLVFAASLFVTLYYKGLQEQAAKTAVGFSALVTLIIGIGFYASVQSEHWQYKGLPEHIDVAEYLPLTANNDFELEKIALRSHAKDDIILPENESFRFHVLSVTPESIRFIADSSRYPTSVIFHRMFFPTWSLRTRSGMSVPLTSDSLGRINAVIPKIKEEYILAIEKSEIEKNGRIISLAGLSILALILLITIFLRNPKVS
jgi:hypothetical protein